MAQNVTEHPSNENQLNVVSVRLVKNAPIMSDKPITTPMDAVQLLGRELCEFDRECLVILCLKKNGVPICCTFNSLGSIDSSIAHPREMFKTAILSNAANMIIIHNHPSGTLTPSESDTAITERMVNLCNLIQIPLLDHIIVGGDNSQYFSFKEKDILPYPKGRTCTDYNEIEFQQLEVAENPVQRSPRRHR